MSRPATDPRLPRGSDDRKGARPGRRRWLLADRVRGLLSLLVLLALLIGIPAALMALRGNPLPDAGLDPNALVAVLTRPDDGGLFLAALTWLAWIGWASFTLSVLVEVPAHVRGLPAPHLPALGAQQRAASALVAGAALLFTLPLTTLSSPALATESLPGAPSTASAPGSAAPTIPPPDSVAGSPAKQARPTYLVVAGDSLWQIAQDQLGDGSRYTEIAQLNYGAPQPDGSTLSADHWLRPGWTLTLPTGASPAASVPESATVTVEAGDTLFEIAEQALGDGARYDEIAAASRHTVQPDGARLGDPDLIRPGWQLTVPGAPAAATQPPPAVDATPALPEPAEAEASGEDVPQPPAVAAPAAPTPAAPAPTAVRPVDSGGQDGRVNGEGGQDAAVVRTAAGVGALMAAGLLALLGTKRARQQRRRRPGQRIAMPPPELAPAELDLRLAEDPAGLARVDQALRTLSVLLGETNRVLPALRLARLRPQQLELYLAEPATLPAPFTAAADPTVWTLDSGAPLLAAAELAAVPAPYPALVTVGHDLDGAHVLLDLEQTGALAVVGDPGSSLAVLAALAAELATSTWADDLQVTLVGCLQALPAALGTGRVRYAATLEELLPGLEHRAADVRAALMANGLPDLQHARTATSTQHAHGDAWTPEIVLLDGPIAPAARSRLDAVLQDLPRIGIAAVTVGDADLSEWALQLDDTDSGPDATAVLAPVDLALRPQRLTAADLDQLFGLLAIADLPPTTDPDNQRGGGIVVGEPAVADLGRRLVHTDPPGPAQVRLVEPMVNLSPDPLDAESDAEYPADAAPITGNAENTRTERPLVQVLGPVDVLHPVGTVESSKRRQLTEIAAYLALNPGLDRHMLNEAIWPGAPALDNTRNTALSKLRKWLGADPDGADYVPRVIEDGYRLHPDVRTDWHLFQQLLPQGPAAASTPALAAALELVQGKPFAGTNPRRYAWAERDRQEIISAIVDVAHELARRALLEPDATLARSAAAAGLQADPGAELLWRDALKAEWLAGDRAGLETTADRLTALAEELGDDLEPETLALLDELLNRPARQVGAR